MKASDIVLSDFTSFLLKGPAGFGKTLAATSFAIGGPVYLAYWDKKEPYELVRWFEKHRPDLLKYIEYDVYGTKNANKYLNKLVEESKRNNYFAIITDSVTNMTSGTVGWSLGYDSQGKTKEFGNNPAKIIPGFDEYKVETSFVTQAIDISREIKSHIIWTAHPIPSIKIEGSGSSMRVTKTNPIVSYGSKVAGIIPGNFSEIYHFSMKNEWTPDGKTKVSYLVSPYAQGDEFAKSALGLEGDWDITNKLFYELWKASVDKLKKEDNDALDQKLATEPKSFLPEQFQTKPTSRWE